VAFNTFLRENVSTINVYDNVYALEYSFEDLEGGVVVKIKGNQYFTNVDKQFSYEIPTPAEN
jgi:hypothetical protein